METRDLVFRPAKKEDLDRLIEMHVVAWPNVTSLAEHERPFTANPFGTLDDGIVGELRGDIVAFAFLYPFEAHFGGRAVRVGGIGSVMVAPEVRGLGVATALMHRLHVASDVRGDAITMLYPFRSGFYERLGYTATTPFKRLAFPPLSIPRTWRDPTAIRPIRGEDQARIRALHARAAARAVGWITRPPGLWQRLFAKPTRHVLVAGDRGYVAFELVAAAEKATMEVDELVADDEATRRVLLGALRAMHEQVAEIRIAVPLEDPLDRLLVDIDARRERNIGTVVAGPAVRIEDATRAIEARGYQGSGSFDVVLGDEIGRGSPADTVAFSVQVEDGRARVSAARGGGALRTDKRTLAATFFGGLRVSDAARLGLLDADERTLARVEAMVALPNACPIDPF